MYWDHLIKNMSYKKRYTEEKINGTCQKVPLCNSPTDGYYIHSYE